MKKILLKTFTVLLILVYTKLTAQNFNLVKDINTSEDGNPTNYYYNLYLGFNAQGFFINYPAIPKYVTLNGITYFSADDGVHGIELWRTDNTAAGTYMVKDLTQGIAGSNPQSLTVAGNTLYFTIGNIVYKSDGTESGTIPVPGITYNTDITTCLTAVGNELYFFTTISRLWKTDGTLAGTSLIIDFRQVYNYSRDYLGQLTNVNGIVYFTTGDDNINGPELWKSDGTQAGTVLVKDIYPGIIGSRPCNLTAVNGKLYFSADDGTGIHLWTSDGTDAGTHAVADAGGVTLQQNLFADYIDITPFTFAQKIIYFKGFTAGKGFELYKYNTANASPGVVLVKDILKDTLSSNPANITAVGSNVYFSINGSAGNQQLWKTDGTNAGTMLVKTIIAAGSDIFSNFTAANGKLLFSCYTNNNGSELWSSDGTTAGTTLVKDIYAGNRSSLPSVISYAGAGRTLFSSNDGNRGIELWKTDGTQNGTVLIKNINDNTTGNSNPALTHTAYYKSNFYFSAYDPAHGYAPYKTDGTAAKTQLVKNIYSGNSANASLFTLFKHNLYFSADSAGFTSVYKTDGTSAGTNLIFNTGKQNVIVTGIYAGTLKLYVFYFDTKANVCQLWASDGTAQGSYKIQDLNVYSSDLYLIGASGSAVTVDNTIYFSSNDSLHGYELWKATAVVGSAKIVKDIFPGAISSQPYNLTAFNGKVYFQAQDSLYAPISAYTSDGTSAGTIKLQRGNGPFASANNLIFFSGYDAATGQELYSSDGTVAGTKLIKDIEPGVYGSYPNYFVSADSVVYFSANDDIHGGELWKSNGAANGTSLVKDFNGSDGVSPYSLTVTDDKIYFLGISGTNRSALFVSNGKASGTHEITDAGLSGVTITYNMASGSNKLYLNGYTYTYGSELYAGSDGSFRPTAESNVSSAIAKQNFAAVIMGNPVRNVMQLSISTYKNQTVHITITDASGKQLAAKTSGLNIGSNIFSFDVDNYAAGIYLVNILGDDAPPVQLKFVK